MLRISLMIVLLYSTLLGSNSFAGADNIDVALSETVPLLMQKLKEKNIKTVGVLPFRLKQDGKGDQFSGSMIQTNLALRLEQALVVYRSERAPIDVIFGMLTQARKAIPDAQWLTEAGRKDLFQLSYELPIGDSKLTPDAFVTGVVEVSADWRDTKIFFEYCLASEPSKLNKSGPYSLKTDRKMLVSMGKGYSVSSKVVASRGVDSALVMEGVQQDVDFQIQEDQKSGVSTPEQRVGKPVSTNPFQSAPVTLTVKYDGQPQSFMRDNLPGSSNLTINDPKGGQRVTFELKNNTANRVAVVLSINGRSMLYDEYAANPDDLSKFVLEAGKTYSVAGVYQKDHKGVQPVVGLSDSQTSDVARQIPTEALGMIHMYVYQPASNVSGTTDVKNTGATGSGGQGSDNKTVGNGTSNQTTNSGTSGSLTNSTKQQSTAQSPSFERSEIEQWKSGFNFALARDAGGKSVKATGSFSPTETTVKAKSWEELADGIAKNLVSGTNTSKGLMLGQGGVQNQEIATSKIGEIQQTEAVVIRYLSVAQ